MMGAFIDLTGKTFGRLTVLREAPKNRSATGRSQRMWLCRCSCGNEKVVFGEKLRQGRTLSCGCLHEDIIKTARDQTTHGESRSRLHTVWAGMLKRCRNPRHHQYANYGGRGISVCPEWYSYEAFQDWAMSSGYDPEAPRGVCTLDRIDVNGNYEPSNCRWVDMKVQASNRRAPRRNHQ